MAHFSRRGALPLFIAALLAGGSVAAHASTAVRTIRFAPGGSSARFDGSLRGYSDVQYRLRASQGQVLHYTVRSRRGQAYAAVYAPGTRPGSAEPLDGTAPASTGEVQLPESGEYTIQVFQMRNSARQGGALPYSLAVRIDGSGR